MLDGHSAVVWQSLVYIWGGKEETSGSRTNVSYSNSMYVINPNECITKPSASMEKLFFATGDDAGSVAAMVPRGRAHHQASMYGKLMFITGGLSEDPIVGTNETADANHDVLPVFDMERRVWALKTTTGDVPVPRCHHVATVYGDTLMVHGGYPVLHDRSKELTAEEMSSMQHALYDVHELNLSSLRWRRIHTSQSPALWGHSAIGFGKNVIVFGGVDVVENAETGTVAVWHTERKAWRWADFQNLDLRCAMHTAVQDSGRMFIFSGVSFKSHQKIRTLHEFNFEFGTWRELHPKGSAPLGRIGHAAVIYNKCMLVIGGSAEQPNSSSLTAGRVERVVHVYNTTQNEWRTCALVTPNQATAKVQRFEGKERNWSSTGADESAISGAKEEWQQTSHQVQSAIAKARAIQSLADTAATAIHAEVGTGDSQQRVASPDHHHSYQGSSPAPPMERAKDYSTGPMEPFDNLQRERDDMEHSRRMAAEANLTPGVASQNGHAVTRVSQTEASPAEVHLEKIRGMREGVSNEDSRRVIEHLMAENDKLRTQVEDFRHHSAAGGDVNPYEVPIYNMRSSPSRTLPENGGVVSPSESRPQDLSGVSSMAEFVPRLNLNVADPPRATGMGTKGFMSRSAVSSMVQRLGKEGASSMALPPAGMQSTTMDPMSFLTSPNAGLNATAGTSGSSFTANSRAPYDQLVAKAPVQGMPNNSGVPLTLQPLLALLSNVQGGGAPAAAPGMSNASFSSPASVPNVSFPNASFGANASVGPGIAEAPGRPAGMVDSGMADSSRKNPSLASVVSGQSSMLSLPGRRKY